MPVTVIKKSLNAEQPNKRRTGHTKAKQPLIPVTMPGRYSMGNVMAVSGWSHTKLAQRISEGKFPKPTKDGHINYWPTDVVRAALGL